MAMKQVFIKEAEHASITEEPLGWLDRADAAFVLLQIAAREGLQETISKKEVCLAGTKSNERTRLQRIDELIALGYVTYTRKVYTNQMTLGLTDTGRKVCAKLKELYDLCAGEEKARVLRLTDADGKAYYVRADSLYADDSKESQQKLEEEYSRDSGEYSRFRIRDAEELRAFTDVSDRLKRGFTVNNAYRAYFQDCKDRGETPLSRRAWLNREKANRQI